MKTWRPWVKTVEWNKENNSRYENNKKESLEKSKKTKENLNSSSQQRAQRNCFKQKRLSGATGQVQEHVSQRNRPKPRRGRQESWELQRANLHIIRIQVEKIHRSKAKKIFSTKSYLRKEMPIKTHKAYYRIPLDRTRKATITAKTLNTENRILKHLERKTK